MVRLPGIACVHDRATGSIPHPQPSRRLRQGSLGARVPARRGHGRIAQKCEGMVKAMGRWMQLPKGGRPENKRPARGDNRAGLAVSARGWMGARTEQLGKVSLPTKVKSCEGSRTFKAGSIFFGGFEEFCGRSFPRMAGISGICGRTAHDKFMNERKRRCCECHRRHPTEDSRLNAEWDRRRSWTAAAIQQPEPRPPRPPQMHRPRPHRTDRPGPARPDRAPFS